MYRREYSASVPASTNRGELLCATLKRHGLLLGLRDWLPAYLAFKDLAGGAYPLRLPDMLNFPGPQ